MSDRADFLSRLEACLGAQSVLTAETDVEGFVEDFKGRFKGTALCVVQPGSTEDVAAVVRLCAEHGVPLIPQGGNTSLCGGAVPSDESGRPVILSLSRMRRMRTIDAVNGTMVVEAGCVLKSVQDAAAEVNLLYPVSLGAEGSCQIGGTISTNAGGTNVLRYGNTRENVLGVEVVLPDGTVWDGLRGLRKDNTGIDLKQIFIGAEGTLGIVTAATLKLHPLPSCFSLAWFAPSSIDAAMRVMSMFRAAASSKLSAFELMNRTQLDLVIRHVRNRKAPLANSADWNVLVELSDVREQAELDDLLQDLLAQAIEEGLILDAVVATNDSQRAELWEVRHSVTEANKSAGIGLSTDCAVPVSAVPQFIDQATLAVRSHYPEMDIVIVGHMGDGNIHFIPTISFERWKAIDDKSAVSAGVRRLVNDVAHKLGGTFSAEHGIGQTGVLAMADYKSDVELRLMRLIKQAIDPQNIMNPGRVLPR
jgi:FAD/FMN-containing dehydrogenase